MGSSSKQVRVKQLEEDRNGLVNYVGLLQKNIAELKQRLVMAQGALQYLNQLLGDKNASHKNSR